MASEKVNLYNQADLKNATDDALANYLNSLGFRQSHVLEDVRLGLGYVALIVAAACFTWDYKLGWEATKLYTACAVGFYAALNGALTLWIMRVEQGTVYQARCPLGSPDENRQLYIATSAKKGAPVYKIKVAIIDDGEGEPTKGFEFETEFAKFWNEKGFFVAEPFQRMLVGNISVVAKADSKRAAAVKGGVVVKEKKEKVSVTGEDEEALSPEMINAVMEAEAEATGTEKKKASKRRKA